MIQFEEETKAARGITHVRAVVAVALGAWVGTAAPVQAQSLRGSPASLDLQNAQAQAHDYTYIRDDAQLSAFVKAGYLTAVRGNRDYDLHAVTYPYARPEAKLFVERLGAQYRAACGEKLVVTSLTRTIEYQRRLSNGSDRSVHPTGMAIDFRRAGLSTRCRRWLEDVLLDLEANGVLEATKENNPAHYHVVLFPDPYAAYLDLRATTPTRSTVVAAVPTPSTPAGYQVRNGDSLWSIAKQYGTSIRALQSANEMNGSRIYPGQVLQVPNGR